MPSLVHNNAMLDAWTGDLDLEEGQDDIRVLLVMTNTTVDTEEEVATVAGFTNLDEFDGANYVAGAGRQLTAQAVAIDAANDRIEFDHEDLTYSNLGSGTRSIQGLLYIRFVTDFNSSIPLAFVEFASPQDPGGSDFTITIDAEGAFQLAQAP